MVAKLARVELYGQLVGALAYGDGSGIATFEYSDDWLQTGIEIAPLHLPLRAGKYRFPQLAWNTYKGLPAVFADSLPDDFGNAVIDAWLATQGKDQAAFTPIDRLLYNGSRGMGALEYGPPLQRPDNPAEDLALESLVALAQQVLDQRAKIKSEFDELHDGLSQLLQVGTSAGGARPKAVIAVNEDRTEFRSGQLSAPKGFTHYLVKFDGVRERSHTSELWGDPQGYGVMEFVYYQMATDLGIEMMPCELLRDGPRAHFMTQRFDRVGNHKRHALTLCGMAHADYKQPGGYSYEQLLSVARQLRLPRHDAEQIYRRMVFNVIARNHDDHTKNTAFIMTEQGQWRLAPAYDVAFSYKPGSYWVEQHQMSINGKRDGFKRSDLLAVAMLIGNFERQAEEIIEQTLAVLGRWFDYAEQAGLDPGLRDHIAQALRLDIAK